MRWPAMPPPAPTCLPDRRAGRTWSSGFNRRRTVTHGSRSSRFRPAKRRAAGDDGGVIGTEPSEDETLYLASECQRGTTRECHFLFELTAQNDQLTFSFVV